MLSWSQKLIRMFLTSWMLKLQDKRPQGARQAEGQDLKTPRHPDILGDFSGCHLSFSFHRKIPLQAHLKATSVKALIKAYQRAAILPAYPYFLITVNFLQNNNGICLKPLPLIARQGPLHIKSLLGTRRIAENEISVNLKEFLFFRPARKDE